MFDFKSCLTAHKPQKENKKGYCCCNAYMAHTHNGDWNQHNFTYCKPQTQHNWSEKKNSFL